LGEHSPHRLAIGAIHVLMAYGKHLEVVLVAENFNEIRAELAGGAEHYDTLGSHKNLAMSTDDQLPDWQRAWSIEEQAAATSTARTALLCALVFAPPPFIHSFVIIAIFA